ncbi:MAG: DNA topoisomerase (ATP-hydrolyzing) subunit B [Ruminococcaceae bacterium]|nr:DNA topoisomerase (ATP-hydrolyzing) subunit B [Oscillospiraceae bacterium]
MDEKELELQEQDVTAADEAYDESQIQVLKGLEAVRKRPGMYIGSTGPRGLHHLVFEIVDNSIDEALAGFCTHIEVEILPGDVITVRDNGRGIPVGMNEEMGLPTVTVVLTVLHAGGKFGGGGYKVAGGLHGVGSSVVNALSEWMEAEISRDGKVYAQRFERGNAVNDLTVIGESTGDGTLIRFKADPTIFTETTEYEYEILQKRLREQAFLNAGLRITLTDSRDAENVKTEEFCYEGGISSFVEYMNKTRGYEVLHNEVIHLSKSADDSFAEVALQYNDSYNENIISFANNMHTVDGGTHENAFKVGITRILNNYARRHGMLKDADANLKGDDVREGLTAVVSVKLQDAQFESQTKAKLGNTSMTTLVNSLLTEKLGDYLEENPAVAKAILEKSINAARVREAAQKAREAARKKSGLASTRMPEKLADCIWNDAARTELYIVEGDSAGGSAIQGRDRNYQAILPLWGKMLNVEKARLDKVYGNEKLIPVVIALGCGIGDDFDISKLRYGKVIIMADADVDGAHIATLLLTFFFRFMRPLVDEGHVYIAQPPLYKVTKGKQVRYAFSDEERDGFIEELGGNADIQRYKGLGEMDPEQLWETTMDPAFRTMLRVTIEDAAAADEAFTILMGDKVEPRREFIEKNARYVENLDV